MLPLLCALLMSHAQAGQTVVDVEVAVFGWEDEPYSGDKFYVRKWVGESFSQQEITETEYQDLVQDSGSCSGSFATTATTVLGTWYTGMSSTTKTKFCHLFQHIAAAD